MNKIMFYIAGLLIAAFLFSGCEELQEGVPTDVSYVPIEDIKVEEDIETEPSFPELEEELEIIIEEPEGELGVTIIKEEEEPEEDLEELEIIIEEPKEEIEELEIIIEEPEEELEELEIIIEEPKEEIEEPELITEEPEEEPAGREIVIIVQETDLVNLKPVAYDPDEDILKFTYSTPLGEEGQWQTTYGDMGEYTITITASDGELTSSKDALLIVNKKEEAPTIDEKSPEEMIQEIDEDTEIDFEIMASDLNEDELVYAWKLDGEEVSYEESYTYLADYTSAGSHTLKLDVSDSISTVSLIWSITVNNVDRPPVLKIIPDITIKENEIVTLAPEASDPDEDEITYTISEPIGDGGIWETTYDDSGVYRIIVTASDGELEDTQEVKVTVINVNRPPVIDNIIQVE
ncbi:MAG: hypothetical protein KAK00_07460 [Nanoarchaeota archaeon]|nr:hypothetical protein [Nanoarchaeota archaeon]